MGIVYEDITIKNAFEEGKARKGLLEESEVHKVTVHAMVDTGTGTLVITEEIMRQLGLDVTGFRQSTLANDGKILCKVTEPVTITWKDRETSCRAVVVPGAGQVLLGAIPLEDMDLIVNPVTRQLVGAHGDEIIYMLK